VQKIYDQFRSCFQRLEMPRGTTIDFIWLKGTNYLIVSIDGKVIDKIYSVNLCNAIFDTYFGENTASFNLKSDITKGFAKLLSN